MLSSIFASPGELGMEVLEADDLAELGDPRKLVEERAVRWQFTFHELGIIGKAHQIDRNQRV